jgi:hypothetical protein
LDDEGFLRSEKAKAETLDAALAAMRVELGVTLGAKPRGESYGGSGGAGGAGGEGGEGGEGGAGGGGEGEAGGGGGGGGGGGVNAARALFKCRAKKKTSRDEGADEDEGGSIDDDDLFDDDGDIPEACIMDEPSISGVLAPLIIDAIDSIATGRYDRHGRWPTSDVHWGVAVAVMTTAVSMFKSMPKVRVAACCLLRAVYCVLLCVVCGVLMPKVRVAACCLLRAVYCVLLCVVCGVLMPKVSVAVCCVLCAVCCYVMYVYCMVCCVLSANSSSSSSLLLLSLLSLWSLSHRKSSRLVWIS